MQILWLFAFLLSEAGDPPSDFRPHKKEQNREVTNISNQPIIFNITYTPWKVKSKTARKADLRFDAELQSLRQKVNGLINGNGENTNHYKIDPKNITLIDDIENDYKRRQGNILLNTVKYIKSEIFETKIRHKVNDKWLKRRLAISHRKVGKLFDGLLASFGGESELLERDFTNRLQEIEKEIEQEREAQGNVEEQLKINSKWTWGK